MTATAGVIKRDLLLAMSGTVVSSTVVEGGAEQGLAVHYNWLPTERLTDWQFATERNMNSRNESDKFW